MGILDDWAGDTGSDFMDWAFGDDEGRGKAGSTKRAEWRETISGKICRERWDFETYRVEVENMIDSLSDYGLSLAYADSSPEEYERLVSLGNCGAAVGMGPIAVPSPLLPTVPPSPYAQNGNGYPYGMVLGVIALLGGGALVGYLMRGGKKKRRR